MGLLQSPLVHMQLQWVLVAEVPRPVVILRLILLLLWAVVMVELVLLRQKPLVQVAARVAVVDMALRTVLVVQEVLVLQDKVITVVMVQFGPAVAVAVGEPQVLQLRAPQARHLLVQVELV
jgi:hypothetical protein